MSINIYRHEWVRGVGVLSIFFIIALITIGGCHDDDAGGGDNGLMTAEHKLNFMGFAIDYDPEVRCADNGNTNQWEPGRTPAACNPQPSFTCPPNSNTLFNCPNRCQECFDFDLNVIKNTLGVDAITIYQPNFYILKAAQMQEVKVIFGTFNDSVVGLAKSDSDTDCTYAGSPLAFCGTKYADALLDGACFDESPWDPNKFCNKPGAFITAFEEFFEEGTVIGVQLGNEVLSTSIGLTKDEVGMAAKNMRTVLDQRGHNNIPVIVSLVAGNEEKFCENGAPPGDVDLIAAHPYCNSVASVPPMWPLDGEACWTQVLQIYADTAQEFCGAENTFIGESGYNTGCPLIEPQMTRIQDADTFIKEAVKWTCSNDVATFLFAYVDACPENGCMPGCSGNLPNVGNGYFGIYHTADYLTTGDIVQKFDPIPTLTCN